MAGLSPESDPLPNVGAGLFGAGLGPYGYGTPAVAPIPGGAVFRDSATGDQLGARRIDPKTGAYVYDAYGRVEGMSAGAQAVYLACKVESGTSSVSTLGHELRSIDRITTNMARRVEQKIRAALAAAERTGLIRIVAIDVEPMNERGAFARVRWLDLETREERETIV